MHRKLALVFLALFLLSQAAPAMDFASHPFQSEGQTIEIKLVDAKSGQPMAGATCYFHAMIHGAEAADKYPRVSKFAKVRDYGRKFQANADGVAKLMFPAGGGHLLAETETHIGFHPIYRTPANGETFHLVPNQRIVVRVADEEGNAVENYPVIYLKGAIGAFFHKTTVDTNADGQAVFENLEIDNEDADFGIHQYIGPGLIDHFMGEMGPNFVKVDQDLLNRGNLQLRTLPTTRLVVKVTNAGGLPFESGGLGTLRVGDIRDLKGTHLSENREVVDGKIVFPHIAVGQAYTFTFRSQQLVDPDRMVFKVPTDAEAVFYQALKLRPRQRIIGIFRDDLGNPVAGRSIAVTEIRKRDWLYSGSQVEIATDQEGRFEYRASDGLEHGWFDEDLRPEPNPLIALEFRHYQNGKVSAEARVRVELPEEMGIFDLGAIPLTSADTSLRVKFVNEDGEPVPKVRVQFWRTHPDGNRKAIPDWENWTDQDGRISGTGYAVGNARFHVSTSHPMYQPLGAEFVPSDLEQVVVLKRVPTLPAEILVDDGITMDDLEFAFTSLEPGFGGVGSQSAITSQPNGWKLRIPAASGVPIKLVIRTQAGEPLFSSMQMVLEPGEERVLEEINPLDLRGKLTELTVKCVTEQGVIIPAEIDIRFGNRSRSHYKWESGITRFVTANGIERMEIRASGRETALLTNVMQSQTVVLKEMLKASLILPKEYLRYRNGEVLYGGGSCIDELGKTRFFGGVAASSEGKVVFEFSKPGEYSVFLLYRPNFGSDLTRNRSEVHSEQLIQVARAGQVIELVVDQPELDALIDRILEESENN